MGIFDVFSSKSYEEIEKKGDVFFDSSDFGSAKLEYEKALSKLDSKSAPVSPDNHKRIKEKIYKSKEGLALQHKTTAENLIDSGCNGEAVELLELALTLTDNNELLSIVEKLLKEIHEQTLSTDDSGLYPYFDDDVDSITQLPDDEYFMALCSTLPEEVQDAYYSYGDSFRFGYIALNQGSFERAAEFLSEAMNENSADSDYISMELATALLNLGEMEKAASLLEQFVAVRPESTRAYGMLCDIFWEEQSYERAINLLMSCPDDLKLSVTINLLMGETLFKAEKYKKAESFYLESINMIGWNEQLAKNLARTYEALDLSEKALEIYGKIMSSCRGCGSRADVFVAERYAELNYERGDISGNLLELYLSLCQQNPQNRRLYFRRISDIYSRQGHHDEAKRYLAFAKGA